MKGKNEKDEEQEEEKTMRWKREKNGEEEEVKRPTRTSSLKDSRPDQAVV